MERGKIITKMKITIARGYSSHQRPAHTAGSHSTPGDTTRNWIVFIVQPRPLRLREVRGLARGHQVVRDEAGLASRSV